MGDLWTAGGLFANVPHGEHETPPYARWVVQQRSILLKTAIEPFSKLVSTNFSAVNQPSKNFQKLDLQWFSDQKKTPNPTVGWGHLAIADTATPRGGLNVQDESAHIGPSRRA